MSSQHFYSYDLNERLSIVARSGDFICRVSYFGFYINLYQLDDYFVEVYKNLLDNNNYEVEIISNTDPHLALFCCKVDI